MLIVLILVFELKLEESRANSIAFLALGPLYLVLVYGLSKGDFSCMLYYGMIELGNSLVLYLKQSMVHIFSYH